MYTKKRAIAILLTFAILFGILAAMLTVGILNPFGFFAYDKLLHLKITSATVKTLYYDEIPNDRFFEGAMMGIAAAAGDPYTRYITVEDSKRFAADIRGGFSGVGMYITDGEDGTVTVVSPIPHSPAERAGIAAGDKLLKIDGDGEFDSTEASRLLLQEAGTKVTIEILKADSGETVELELVRENIVIPTVDAKMLGNDILYIGILQFSTHTAAEFAEKLREFSSGAKGVIIDVRNNGGGTLDAAVDIADMFLPQERLIVYSEGGGKRQDYKARSARFTDIPVVFLQNRGSASASEVLIGALRDNEIAVSVGEKTFGKGTIQNSISLPCGGILNVTIAKYYSPNGVCIDKEGIEPDFEVELVRDGRPLSALNEKDDAQLQFAIRKIRERINY